MLVQQDDERIIQEIQKEGEAELNKKSAGGSPQCLCLSRLSLRSSHVILIWTDVEIRELIFPCRNQSPYFIPLRGFLSVLFRQLSCLQHKPAADAGLFPVFSLYHCVCVKCVRQAGVFKSLGDRKGEPKSTPTCYYTGQEDAALPLIFALSVFFSLSSSFREFREEGRPTPRANHRHQATTCGPTPRNSA